MDTLLVKNFTRQAKQFIAAVPRSRSAPSRVRFPASDAATPRSRQRSRSRSRSRRPRALPAPRPARITTYNNPAVAATLTHPSGAAPMGSLPLEQLSNLNGKQYYAEIGADLAGDLPPNSGDPTAGGGLQTGTWDQQKILAPTFTIPLTGLNGLTAAYPPNKFRVTWKIGLDSGYIRRTVSLAPSGTPGSGSESNPNRADLAQITEPIHLCSDQLSNTASGTSRYFMRFGPDSSIFSGTDQVAFCMFENNLPDKIEFQFPVYLDFLPQNLQKYYANSPRIFGTRDISTGRPMLAPFYENQFIEKFNFRFVITPTIVINMMPVYGHILGSQLADEAAWNPQQAALEAAAAGEDPDAGGDDGGDGGGDDGGDCCCKCEGGGGSSVSAPAQTTAAQSGAAADAGGSATVGASGASSAAGGGYGELINMAQQEAVGMAQGIYRNKTAEYSAQMNEIATRGPSTAVVALGGLAQGLGVVSQALIMGGAVYGGAAAGAGAGAGAAGAGRAVGGSAVGGAARTAAMRGNPTYIRPGLVAPRTPPPTAVPVPPRATLTPSTAISSTANALTSRMQNSVENVAYGLRSRIPAAPQMTLQSSPGYLLSQTVGRSLAQETRMPPPPPQPSLISLIGRDIRNMFSREGGTAATMGERQPFVRPGVVADDAMPESIPSVNPYGSVANLTAFERNQRIANIRGALPQELQNLPAVELEGLPSPLGSEPGSLSQSTSFSNLPPALTVSISVPAANVASVMRNPPPDLSISPTAVQSPAAVQLTPVPPSALSSVTSPNIGPMANLANAISTGKTPRQPVLSSDPQNIGQTPITRQPSIRSPMERVFGSSPTAQATEDQIALAATAGKGGKSPFEGGSPLSPGAAGGAGLRRTTSGSSVTSTPPTPNLGPMTAEGKILEDLSKPAVKADMRTLEGQQRVANDLLQRYPAGTRPNVDILPDSEGEPLYIAEKWKSSSGRAELRTMAKTNPLIKAWTTRRTQYEEATGRGGGGGGAFQGPELPAQEMRTIATPAGEGASAVAAGIARQAERPPLTPEQISEEVKNRRGGGAIDGRTLVGRGDIKQVQAEILRDYKAGTFTPSAPSAPRGRGRPPGRGGGRGGGAGRGN